MSEQGTEQWHQERLGKVTASRISDVMMKPTTAGYQNYKAQLICERLTGEPTQGFISAAMQHGTETEPQARAMYTLITGIDVEETGFVDHPSIAMTGASPDGLAGGDGLLEIKCPQPAEHIRMLMGGDIQRKYILQMQWQMVCTGREWCDFVSFSPAFPPEMQLQDAREMGNPELQAEITEAVERILAEVNEAHGVLIERYGKEAA